MVNPAKLSPERRMEVCMQCHMETTSGRIPAVLQAFNRSTFSYIPGQPLADFAISFDHAPGTGHEGKFEAVSSVYRLRQSRCFLESAGKLECATCHDPHRIPRGEEAVRKYSGVCLQCHTSEHPAGVAPTAADCITCHMPKRRADDAPHVIMTDHLIQRGVIQQGGQRGGNQGGGVQQGGIQGGGTQQGGIQQGVIQSSVIQSSGIQRSAPANALTEFAERPAEEYHGPVVPYYPAQLPNTPRNDLYRAVAQVGLGNNVAAGLPVLARLIEENKPREPEFYMVLGDGWKMAGNLPESAKAYRQALEIAPDSARAMRALAAVDEAHAEQILKHALEVAPKDVETRFRLGVLTSSAELIRQAILLDPWMPDQWRRLAEVTRGEAELGAALKTDPFDDAAWDLGGRILAEKGKLVDAFFDFERAVKLNPSGRYLYDYALELVRADRFEEAQAKAEMSVRADGAIAESHELLGGLYARKKQLPDAVREYAAALSLNPGSARVELRLGTVLAAAGDKAGAQAHLREAARASDAAIARQAEQALRDLGIR